MVPFSTFIQMEKVYGPEQITRYNMFNAIMINGDAAPGYSSGDAIKAVERAALKLPRGYTYEWSGMTREEVISGNQTTIIFIICLIFVYLILAAQYESFYAAAFCYFLITRWYIRFILRIENCRPAK